MAPQPVSGPTWQATHVTSTLQTETMHWASVTKPESYPTSNHTATATGSGQNLSGTTLAIIIATVIALVSLAIATYALVNRARRIARGTSIQHNVRLPLPLDRTEVAVAVSAPSPRSSFETLVPGKPQSLPSRNKDIMLQHIGQQYTHEEIQGCSSPSAVTGRTVQVAIDESPMGRRKLVYIPPAFL